MFASSGPESVWSITFVYIVSVILSLSPLGEWVLGLMSGARKMKRADMRERIVPLLTEVHNRALELTPDMTRVINLKVSYDPNPNAFALGRHTICVTEGLFSLTDEQIEGILAHELGHLAYHHTVIQLLIGGGNFIITFVLFIFRMLAYIFTFIGSIFSFSRDDTAEGIGCGFSIFGLICSLMVLLWTKFCMLFLMWSSRANEYVADKYAFDLDCGYGLAHALDTIGTGVPQNSLLKALYSTHPETHDRIGRLQELGVPYYKY